MHPQDFNRQLTESNWFNSLKHKDSAMTTETQPARMGDDAVAPDLAWSCNQEEWQYDTLEELLDHMRDMDSLEAGQVVWFGEKHRPRARQFVPDSERIVEQMNENAGESDGGEWAEDFATDVAPAALKELDSMLEEWADKHCPVTWWLIEKTTEYTITQEDIDHAER